VIYEPVVSNVSEKKIVVPPKFIKKQIDENNDEQIVENIIEKILEKNHEKNDDNKDVNLNDDFQNIDINKNEKKKLPPVPKHLIQKKN
jgi:hypothetical protein